jgi:hypothetical protein
MTPPPIRLARPSGLSPLWAFGPFWDHSGWAFLRYRLMIFIPNEQVRALGVYEPSN